MSEFSLDQGVGDRRKEAEIAFRKNPFHRAWDPRVLHLWLEYGLREANEGTTDEAVMLTTSPAQEVFFFLRPNYLGSGHDGKPIDRRTHADVDPRSPINYPFYRPEPARIFHALPCLRPSALYIFADPNHVSALTSAYNDLKVSRTGTGVGGSGGVREGRVKSVIITGVGHMVPLEAPNRTAQQAAIWIGEEIRRWNSDEAEHERVWKSKTLTEKQTIDQRWKQEIGGRFITKNPPRQEWSAKI